MMKEPMIDVGYDLSSMNYGNEDFVFIINILQAAGVESIQLGVDKLKEGVTLS